MHPARRRLGPRRVVAGGFGRPGRSVTAVRDGRPWTYPRIVNTSRQCRITPRSPRRRYPASRRPEPSRKRGLTVGLADRPRLERHELLRRSPRVGPSGLGIERLLDRFHVKHRHPKKAMLRRASSVARRESGGSLSSRRHQPGRPSVPSVEVRGTHHSLMMVLGQAWPIRGPRMTARGASEPTRVCSGVNLQSKPRTSEREDRSEMVVHDRHRIRPECQCLTALRVAALRDSVELGAAAGTKLHLRVGHDFRTAKRNEVNTPTIADQCRGTRPRRS